jgi:hypothetical protein
MQLCILRLLYISNVKCLLGLSVALYPLGRTNGARNRGQLAEGWYDPQQLETAAQAPRQPTPPPRPTREAPRPAPGPAPADDASSDSEDLGPALPTRQSAVSGHTIPSFGDLRLKRGKSGSHPSATPLTPPTEDEAEDFEDRRAQLRQERRAERALEKARLDELAPKAEAGTRERQLEKRREAAASNRAFAAAKDGGDAPEVADGELLGEGEDSLQSFRREKQEQERRKTDKQLRRDEIARARRAEREERVREFQQREERTMEGLMKLARERYG